MARPRNPNRDKAFEIYKEHNGDIDLVEIASQLNTPDGTIRGWKSKDKWDSKLGRERNRTERNKERNVPKKKNNVTKKKSEPIAEEVKSVLENDDLNDKQRLFCIYYNKYFNATKAYQKAYDCTYETAMANGSNLLRNTKIKDEIYKLKQGKLNKVMLEEEDLFQMYLDIATADITDYVEYGQEEELARAKDGTILLDKDGNELTYTDNYVNFKDSKQVDGTLVSEVSKGRSGVKIKLHDKMKALDWLDRHIGLASEEQKARIEVMKAKVSLSDNEELEDDGFLEALTGKVDEIWQEE